MTCLTGAFDLIHTPNGMDPPGTPADTCFSEALERNPHGGAIGIVASSRVAVTFDCGFLTWGLMNYLWPEYSEYTLYPRPETPRGMGDALNYAKLYGKSRLWNGGNITFEEWHWFGDPATRFWTGVPKNLKVSQPDSLKINTNENITISVTDEQNNPIEEAMVTISTVNAPSDYWRATTDASGNAVFSLIITQSDDYDIVVTKSEFLSYQGTVYSSGVNYNKIFVDKANSGTADGSPEHPLSKVSQGVTQVNSYGTVAIKTGVYGAGENKPLRINKAMKLQAVGGPVTIKPS
jgi:hypothetical protein